MNNKKTAAPKAVKKPKMASFVIPKSDLNKEIEYINYQVDGRIFTVDVGKATVVPLEIADIAKRRGDIDDYVVIG